MTRFSAAQVQRYYDRHTPAFIAFGQGGSDGVIHRAVWGPGVHNRREAFHYVEDQIAEVIRQMSRAAETMHLVDLGCGVGASLCYLAERLPIRGTGITLSPVQAELATERIAQRGLSERVVCIQSDYCNLPRALGPADFAYAIESFVHGPDPAGFFAQCSQLVRRGGKLVICDDFKRPTDDRDAARAIEQFSAGWHINALVQRAELQALARAAGFEHESTRDLSSYLEIHRARDRAIKAVLALIARLPLPGTPLAHLVAGNSLQTCLERGWIGYDLAVFRRIA
jgi:SAM-dependent methyltransferase